MNSRRVLYTFAAMLTFGLVFTAGSWADQGGGDNGHGKQDDKNKKEQHQKPQQHQQQPRQQPQRQNPPQPQRQYPPHGRPQQPPAQAPQQRPADPGRGRGPAPDHSRWQQTPPRQPQPTSPPRRYRPTPDARPGLPLMTRERNTTTYRVQQQTVWPRFRAQSWRTQHRTWGQRGGYNGYRIPTTQFSLYFGRPHRFHVSSFQVRVYSDYPQFYADGFWFTMLDPVPEYWQPDWYDTDYCYVVEMSDGYYLIDDSYPDDAVAISVQLP